MSDQPKPCPFCGSTDVQFRRESSHTQSTFGWVSCEQCFAESCAALRDEAWAAWNRRVDDSLREENARLQADLETTRASRDGFRQHARDAERMVAAERERCAAACDEYARSIEAQPHTLPVDSPGDVRIAIDVLRRASAIIRGSAAAPNYAESFKLRDPIDEERQRCLDIVAELAAEYRGQIPTWKGNAIAAHLGGYACVVERVGLRIRSGYVPDATHNADSGPLVAAHGVGTTSDNGGAVPITPGDPGDEHR